MGFFCHAGDLWYENTCKLHSEMVLLLHIRLRIFFDLTGTEGKDRSKTSIYHKFFADMLNVRSDLF